MAKKMITKLNEYNEHQMDMVVEMATISGKDFPYHVGVNGGNSYGSGRNEHREPHFHYSDNVKTPQKFNLTILIPTKNEWSTNKELLIVPKSSKPSNWTGLSREKKMLIEWLDEPNVDAPMMSNYEMIRLQWNILNKHNRSVRQLID